MPELHDLLHDHAGEVRDTDVAADLRRGHRALTRRRARFAGGTLAACAAATAAVVAWPGDQPGDRPDGASVATDGSATPSTTPSSDPSTAAPTPEQTPPAGLLESDFMYYPDLGHGYEVTSDQQAALVFTRNGAQAGSFADSPTLELGDPRWPLNFGREKEYQGQIFYIANSTSEPSSTVSFERPDGWWLSMQLPTESGLSEREVMNFLLAVQVKQGDNIYGAQG